LWVRGSADWGSDQPGDVSACGDAQPTGGDSREAPTNRTETPMSENELETQDVELESPAVEDDEDKTDAAAENSQELG